MEKYSANQDILVYLVQDFTSILSNISNIKEPMEFCKNITKISATPTCYSLNKNIKEKIL